MSYNFCVRPPQKAASALHMMPWIRRYWVHAVAVLLPLAILLIDYNLSPVVLTSSRNIDAVDIATLLTTNRVLLGRYRAHDIFVSLGSIGTPYDSSATPPRNSALV